MAHEFVNTTVLKVRDEATTQWNKFQNEVERGVGRIQRQFDKIRTVALSAFSIYTLKGFIDKSNEAEVAANRLRTALSLIGDAADTDPMIKYAEALQKQTTFSHDDIEMAQAMLVSFTKLHGTALNPLTKATLDLATGMHLSAEQAATLIGKSMEGMNALGRYGISIKGATTESEKLQKITEGIEKVFGGMAAGAVNTAAGKMEQIKNKISDVQERFGDLLKNGIAPLLDPLGKLLDWFDSAPQWIQTTTLVVGGLTVAFVALGVAMGPITLALIGAAGLVTALISTKESTLSLEEETNRLNNSIDKLNGKLPVVYATSIHAADGADALAKKFREMNNQTMIAAHAPVQVYHLIAAHGDAAAKAAPSITVITNSLSYFNQKIADEKKALDALNPSSQAYIKLLARITLEQARLDSTMERSKKAAFNQAMGWNGITAMAGKGFNQQPITAMTAQVQKLVAQMQPLAQISLPPLINAKTWEDASRAADAMAGSAQRVGQAMASAILSNKDPMKAALKAIADEFINQAEAMLYASEATAIATDIATFNFAKIAADLAIIAIGTAALETARGYVAKMHQGGSFYVNAPASTEVPIMVRGGERGIIQTEAQQRNNPMGGGGNTIHFHFNAPVSDETFVKNAILSTLRKTGSTIDKVYVDKQSNVTVNG